MPFPRGQRGYYCTHISASLPGVTQVIRDTSVRCLWDSGFQEMHRTAFYSFINLKFPFPSFNLGVSTTEFYSCICSHLKCPSTTRQLPPGQYPFKCQLNPGCQAEGRSHRDHLDFEQGFSDPTFSCWGKERNHLPSHGWVKQTLHSRTAAAKPKAAKGGVKQLSQDAAVISQGSPASSTNSITQPEWKRDPLAPGLLLGGSKAAYPWFTPAVEVSGAGAPQLCHSCPWLSSLPSAPTRPNQLWGILWAQSWAPGLVPVHSENWEQVWGDTNSSSPKEMRTCRIEEETATGWLWISLHSVCTCSCAVRSAWIYCFLYHWSYICLSLQCL